MDSQHRHELQQNDLGKLTNKAVPFFEKYGWHVVGAVAGIVVLFIGGAWYAGQATTSTAESWAQLDRVLHQPNASSGDYASIVEKHANTNAAGWARLKEAEDYLKSGLQAAFTNKDASQADLKNAQEILQKLSSGGPGVTAEVQERAMFGLARCLEALSDGKDDHALEAYRQLLRKFPTSIFESVANERIAALESEDTKGFYAWFHQQHPKPADPQVHPFKPRPGDTGGEREEDGDVMDNPLSPESEGAGTEDAPATEKPREESSEESTEKTPEKPGTDKPATEDSSEKPEDDASASSSGKSAAPESP